MAPRFLDQTATCWAGGHRKRSRCMGELVQLGHISLRNLCDLQVELSGRASSGAKDMKSSAHR